MVEELFKIHWLDADNRTIQDSRTHSIQDRSSLYGILYPVSSSNPLKKEAKWKVSWSDTAFFAPFQIVQSADGYSGYYGVQFLDTKESKQANIWSGIPFRPIWHRPLAEKLTRPFRNDDQLGQNKKPSCKRFGFVIGLDCFNFISFLLEILFKTFWDN